MLTSATRGEMLTPNPNECNSTLTSGTNNIYPYPYIDINDRVTASDRGSPLQIGVTAYELPTRAGACRAGEKSYLSMYTRDTICFFRDFMGLKSHKFSWSLLAWHLYTRQLACEPQTGSVACLSVAVTNGT